MQPLKLLRSLFEIEVVGVVKSKNSNLEVKRRTPQVAEYENVMFYDVERDDGSVYHGMIRGSMFPEEGDYVEMRISRLSGMFHESDSDPHKGHVWYGLVKECRILRSEC
jgi:hypothetical protein